MNISLSTNSGLRKIRRTFKSAARMLATDHPVTMHLTPLTIIGGMMVLSALNVNEISMLHIPEVSAKVDKALRTGYEHYRTWKNGGHPPVESLPIGRTEVTVTIPPPAVDKPPVERFTIANLESCRKKFESGDNRAIIENGKPRKYAAAGGIVCTEKPPLTPEGARDIEFGLLTNPQSRGVQTADDIRPNARLRITYYSPGQTTAFLWIGNDSIYIANRKVHSWTSTQEFEYQPSENTRTQSVSSADGTAANATVMVGPNGPVITTLTTTRNGDVYPYRPAVDALNAETGLLEAAAR